MSVANVINVGEFFPTFTTKNRKFPLNVWLSITKSPIDRIPLFQCFYMTRSLLFCAGLFFSTLANTQDSIQANLGLFEPAPEINKARFWTMTGVAIGGYSAAMIGLNQLWYADYERSSFQLFDDSKEWNQMDKAGHAFTAYFETAWAYGVARWTGLDRKKSLIVGVTLSTLYQTSIEVLDGFSEK